MSNRYREQKVRHLPDRYQNLAVSFVKELVKRDSSNPPGDEYEVAAYIATELRKAGLKVCMDEFEPRRCNIRAILGDQQKTGLLFLGHTDVVPAQGEWSYGKFLPEVFQGNLYGRGTADMKGGLGAIMAAVIALADGGIQLNKNVTLLMDSDEERTNKGIDRILSHWNIEAESAIVGEPSNLQLMLGNRGYSSFYIKTIGISGHASDPRDGDNAIYKMAEAIRIMEKYAKHVENIIDPYLGKATFSVGTIRGGTTVNMVPDECYCEVERRLLPGETDEGVKLELENLLKGVAEVLPRAHPTPPSLLEKEHPFVIKTAQAMSRVLGKEPKIGVFAAGTEAAYISQFGIPTLIVGPGSLEQAHSVDEFVSITQIKQCADIYYQLVQMTCCNSENCAG